MSVSMGRKGINRLPGFMSSFSTRIKNEAHFLHPKMLPVDAYAFQPTEELSELSPISRHHFFSGGD